MRFSADGANIRSKNPPTPPAPFHVVWMRTCVRSPSGANVNVVTSDDASSRSSRTLPGVGTETRIRYGRLRPPAVTVKLTTVPSPVPPSSTL